MIGDEEAFYPMPSGMSLLLDRIVARVVQRLHEVALTPTNFDPIMIGYDR